MSKNSDRWFLAIWVCFAVTVVLCRRIFIGDGVRHIAHIVSHSAPSIGEARWLFFPAFLFSFLRPLYSLGLIHTVEGALIPFGLASVVSSVIYLAAVRVWLIHDQIPTHRRWIALAMASVCPAFLIYSTDGAEPLFAATLCVVGLAIVVRTRRLPLGVLFMSLGLLLHQTVFVGFFLLPMAIGWDKLRDVREILRTAVVIASVAVVTLGMLMVANHTSLSDALERIFLVYRNPIHMNWMRGGLLKGVGVTLFGGYPQGLVVVRGIHGIRGILSGLRQMDIHAMGLAFRLGVGFLLVSSGVVYAYRHRRWEWFVALFGFSILPVVWNNVYGYPKFYMLFPVLAAHVIARVSPRVSIPVAVIVALLNVSALVADVREGREKFSARAAQYKQATVDTRWITSGWHPDVPYRWPGPDCGMLKSLAKPSTATTLEDLRAERTGEFTECIRDAFCSGHPVWTDDWVQGNAETIGAIATYHGLSRVLLDKTWWRGANDGQAVDVDSRHSLFIFSTGRQSEICRTLNEDRTREVHP